MGKRTLLDDAEVTRRLAALPGWTREGKAIRRTFTFKAFPEAVRFIDGLVGPAEALNHHPDVDLRYNRVIVTLATHDAGGLTELDFELASKM
jgi:4a-hydroxytetrahydrobiopterin dehydratase